MNVTLQYLETLVMIGDIWLMDTYTGDGQNPPPLASLD